MYIVLRRNDFPDDSYKVAFMMSHLKGSTLDWFQSAITNGATGVTNWMNSVPNFIDELCRLFGPRDPTTEATICLKNLRYKNSSKAVKYTLGFNRDAPWTG